MDRLAAVALIVLVVGTVGCSELDDIQQDDASCAGKCDSTGPVTPISLGPLLECATELGDGIDRLICDINGAPDSVADDFQIERVELRVVGTSRATEVELDEGRRVSVEWPSHGLGAYPVNIRASIRYRLAPRFVSFERLVSAELSLANRRAVQWNVDPTFALWPVTLRPARDLQEAWASADIDRLVVRSEYNVVYPGGTENRDAGFDGTVVDRELADIRRGDDPALISLAGNLHHLLVVEDAEVQIEPSLDVTLVEGIRRNPRRLSVPGPGRYELGLDGLEALAP